MSESAAPLAAHRIFRFYSALHVHRLTHIARRGRKVYGGVHWTRIGCSGVGKVCTYTRRMSLIKGSAGEPKKKRPLAGYLATLEDLELIFAQVARHTDQAVEHRVAARGGHNVVLLGLLFLRRAAQHDALPGRRLNLGLVACVGVPHPRCVRELEGEHFFL